MRWREPSIYKWHRWFAWHPITIDEVGVWLETVERRRDSTIRCFVYREARK